MGSKSLDKRIKLTSVKLKGGDAALIFDAEKNMFDILIPSDVESRSQFVLEHQLLTAMYIRLNTDPEFAMENIKFLQEYQNNPDETEELDTSIILTGE